MGEPNNFTRRVFLGAPIARRPAPLGSPPNRCEMPGAGFTLRSPLRGVRRDRGTCMRPEDQFRLAQESRQAAQALAEAFRRGVQPQAVDVRMALQPGEYCTGYVPVTVLQYLAADTSWTKKGGGYVIGGSPAGLVFGGAYSAL